MMWGEASPGDLVEFKMPGAIKKRYGIYLGIRWDDPGIQFVDILGEKLESIPLLVNADDIKVSVRSSLEYALG